MSAASSGPSQWDESNYRAFPSFTDWRPEDYDTALVDRYEQQLQSLRARVSDEDLGRALAVVNRYAAIDTGAIEGLYQVDRGFTRTVATQTAAWESALALKGVGVKRAIEDALRAYDYVLDAVTGAVPISEVWIRELHQIICKSQESFTVITPVGPQEHALPKGVYKTMPNSPTSVSTGRVHAYAPPSQTPAEMARLMTELRSDEFKAAHPVLQAAYAHYVYVAIHPFSDGNGRVARALASVYLYRSPGVPLVVFADQRDRYLDALEAADGGDSGPFVRFVETRTVDAVSLLEASLQSDMQGFDVDLADLQSIFSDDGSSTALLQGADRVKALARGAIDEALSAVGLPDSVKVQSINTGSGGPGSTGHWRSVGSRERFRTYLSSEYPMAARVDHLYEVLVRGTGLGAEFGLRRDGADVGVEVWFRDVVPLETESVRLRVQLWAEREARALVHAFSEVARQARDR